MLLEYVNAWMDVPILSIGLEVEESHPLLEPQGVQTDSFPEDRRNAVDAAVKQHDQDAEVALDEQLEDNSPYPGVVAAVRNSDEEVPANTIRAWVLGMLFVGSSTPLSFLFLSFLFLNFPYFVSSLTWVDDDRIST